MGYYVQIRKIEVDMTKEEARKAIEELSQKIEYHSRKYYVDDSPEISDFEYDKMFYRLKSLEEQYPDLSLPTSPTRRVGGKALDKFEKTIHAVKMGS